MIKMSCTIYFKGKLNVGISEKDVLGIIERHLQGINAKLAQSNNPIIIEFLQGQSEPLVFQFINNKIDGLCKWSGEEPEEFYAILDLFIDLKPLF